MSIRAWQIGGAIALGLATAAAAQDETTNRVAASTDWSVFQESDPVECFGVSAPKDSVNTRDGQAVQVSRGETLLFVFYRPAEGVNGQVTFTGGYPFASGSTVTMNVGGTDYQLFTEGEWAWPATPQDDAQIVTAMKAGSEAVLTGVSGRGTMTRDTFSLLGFTAAVEEAARPVRRMRCALPAALAALAAVAGHAQDAAEPAWTVYVEGAEACYAVSAPTAQANTRDGESVEVSRGITRLMVAWRPAEGVVGQVSFTGGYPFDEGSTVTLEAGAESYDLAIEGEWAWPATPEGDATVIAQLRGVGEASLSGTSSRGTATRDTFSMLGFGAAVDEAARRCTEG